MHNKGPSPNNVDVEFQNLMISSGKFIINCKSSSNNCYLLKDGKYILVVNVIQKRDKDICLIGNKLKYVKDLYEIPCLVILILK